MDSRAKTQKNAAATVKFDKDYFKLEALKQDIVHLNPQAFINGNPEQLLADKRLWLPGYMKQADSKADPETTTVERYSWGNIKRKR